MEHPLPLLMSFLCSLPGTVSLLSAQGQGQASILGEESDCLVENSPVKYTKALTFINVKLVKISQFV